MAKRGQNKGTIHIRKDGRWTAAVSLGYRDGKRIRKSIYGATRKEVQGKLTTTLQAQQLGLPITQDRLTVGQHLEQWLSDTKQHVRQKTYRTYRDLTLQHLKPALGRIPLSKLGPHDVRKFMREKEAFSPRTVKHLRDTLRCALNSAMRDGLIVRNVAALAKPPAVPKSDLKVLGPDEARRFVQLIDGHRLEALFTVAISLGLREAEALGLRWCDVDFESKTLAVRHQLQRIKRDPDNKDEKGKLHLIEPKSEKSRRTVSLPSVTLSALSAHRTLQEQEKLVAGSRWKESGMVFTTTIGTMLDARNLLKQFYRIIRTSDLPQIRFHDLRHSAATLLLAQGVHMKAVQEILGHASFSTTANVYAHVLPAMQREAAAKMDAVFSPVAVTVAVNKDDVKPN